MEERKVVFGRAATRRRSGKKRPANDQSKKLNKLAIDISDKKSLESSLRSSQVYGLEYGGIVIYLADDNDDDVMFHYQYWNRGIEDFARRRESGGHYQHYSYSVDIVTMEMKLDNKRLTKDDTIDLKYLIKFV